MSKDQLLKMRVTQEEKEWLTSRAGDNRVSEYVRSVLFRDMANVIAVSPTPYLKEVSVPKGPDIFAKPSKNVSTKGKGAKAFVHKWPDGYDPITGYNDPALER